MEMTRPAAKPASIDDIDGDCSPDDEAMAPFTDIGRTLLYGALAWAAATAITISAWQYSSSRQPAVEQPAKPAATYQGR